jgi:hypothetical protein
MRDALTDALNAPEGRLAEIVVRKLASGDKKDGPPEGSLQRLETLIQEPGRSGFLARIRLAAEVSLLFEYAPEWTSKRIVPLFDWKCPEAADAWEARKYSSYIGSPQLFNLTKASLLELFGRNDVPAENQRIFAEWLTTILLENQRHQNVYALTGTEARAALRRAGVKVLSSVGHRLAVEMEQAKPEEKVDKWNAIVGPVFEAMWPLDVELQGSASTFKLVQLLLATGSAFRQAARVITPFVRPEDPRSHTSVYSISVAPDEIYAANPDEMLSLLVAVVGTAAPGSVHSLRPALERLSGAKPELRGTAQFQRLLTYAAD